MRKTFLGHKSVKRLSVKKTYIRFKETEIIYKFSKINALRGGRWSVSSLIFNKGN